MLVQTRATTVAPTCQTRRMAFVRRAVTVRSSAKRDVDTSDTASASKRALLVASVVSPFIVSLLGDVKPVSADDYKQFLGYSQAPDLYMGYGQAKDSPPLYSFEYPANWTEDIPTKTEKSTMGMDGRVMHPKTRKEMAYVVALGGKDYRDSVLKDAKTSLIVFAGSDPDMRQALTDGTVKQAQKKINGTDMFMYDITSDKRRYLSTIGKKGDTIFALVVTASNAAFEKDGAQLQHIQDTFKLL